MHARQERTNQTVPGGGSAARRAALAAFAALALAGPGCTGQVGSAPAEAPEASPSGPGAPSPGGSGGPPAGPGGSPGGAAGGAAGTKGCAQPTVGPSLLRRLTRTEYQLTLQELFRLDAAPELPEVPEDARQGGFRTLSALQSATDQHLRAYLDVATRMAKDLLADGKRRPAVLGCEPAAAGCLDAFTASFGALAFRRPLEPAERTALLERARKLGTDAADQHRFVIEALLTSPSFLYRFEVGGGGQLATLSGQELASKLSFALWGRGPSAELLARGAKGDLATGDGVAKVAAEMLADGRARPFYREFFKQWLDFEQLRVPKAPPAGWSDALLGDMTAETERLIDELAWGPGGNFLDALTANHTYVTPRLAKFYGLPAPAGTAAARVSIPEAHPRRDTGLLSHASLTSAKSDGDLIAHRGKWIRGAFFCEELDVPPGLLENLQDQLSGLSYVDMVKRRNSEASCAGCHRIIDPAGAAFVQFDAAGAYDASKKASDYGIKLRLEGAAEPEIGSLADLAKQLKITPAVGRCLAREAFVYVHGRRPAAEDECAVAEAAARFAASGHRLPALLEATVASPAFRLRRAPTAPAGTGK